MKYFFKKYKFDVLTALFAMVGTFLAFILVENPKVLFISSLVVIFISLFIIVYLRTKDKSFYFISFKKEKDKYDWMGREGIFEYVRGEKCFVIADSGSGYIYSKSLTWSNYRVSFEFKIIINYIGAIVRASNLSNYVMLQIRKEGIRPHIKVNEGWSSPESWKIEFENNLSLDKWYKCVLTCDADSIDIVIFDKDDKKEKICNRRWSIPLGTMDFYFKKDETDKNPIKISFPINLEYGSVGFRSAVGEKALIQNFLIEKI